MRQDRRDIKTILNAMVPVITESNHNCSKNNGSYMILPQIDTPMPVKYVDYIDIGGVMT